MTVPASLRGPAAMNALVPLLRDALPPSVAIVDGPRTAQEIGAEVLFVGWAQDLQAAFTETRVDQDENLCSRATAEGDIFCRLSIGNGDADILAARTRAAELFELIETAIRGTPDLGGAVDNAEIGPEIAGSQEQLTDNIGAATVSISFTVSYTAYI